MTVDEAGTLLQYMSTDYPNFKSQNMGFTVTRWASAFEGTPFEVVLSAYNAYVLKGSDYAPNVGHIAKIIKDNVSDPKMSELEAWGEVVKAVRDSDRAAEHFENFSLEIKRAVGCPENIKAWGRDITEEEFNTVIQSNFIKNYRIQEKKFEEYANLPEHIRAKLPISEMLNIEKKDDIFFGDEPKKGVPEEFAKAMEELKEELFNERQNKQKGMQL